MSVNQSVRRDSLGISVAAFRLVERGGGGGGGGEGGGGRRVKGKGTAAER